MKNPFVLLCFNFPSIVQHLLVKCDKRNYKHGMKIWSEIAENKLNYFWLDLTDKPTDHVLKNSSNVKVLWQFLIAPTHLLISSECGLVHSPHRRWHWTEELDGGYITRFSSIWVHTQPTVQISEFWVFMCGGLWKFTSFHKHCWLKVNGNIHNFLVIL